MEDEFREAYRFVLPGYNLRPLEICGAVGVEQLKKLDAVVDARRANARRFVELFGRDERFIIQRDHGAGSWFAFTLILNPALPANTLREFVELARGSKPPLFYASIGNGSNHHLAMEMLKQHVGRSIPM